ncbi:MAG: tyrosine-protein phosphatase [Clostridia bacterium]|nr:tyrosine-protein phosphatase [Clostridia bacterium]
MKKAVVLILSVIMTFSLLAAAGSVSADSSQLKVVMNGYKTVFETVGVNNAALSRHGENLVVTTKGADSWIDVSLPDVNTKVYDTFIIKYKASGAVSGDSIYLKAKNVNTSYGRQDGTFADHGFTVKKRWWAVSYNIASVFPAVSGSKLNGIRIPVCADEGATIEIESILFISEVYFSSTEKTPEQPGKVFAGWFSDPDLTIAAVSGPAFAKFVDKDAHKVKWQIRPNEKDPDQTDIRFVTTIDDLNYKKVGFRITFDGKTVDVSTTKAFKRLKAGGEGIAPSVFSAESQYFVTYVIEGIPEDKLDKSFSVKAYWITLDDKNGDGAVYGETLSFCIGNPDGATARVVGPGTGETISLLTDEMTEWVNNYSPQGLNEICDFTEKCEPLPVILKWDKNDGVLYTHVLISQNADMSSPDVYLCFENSLNVEDLYSGTTYYWQLRKEFADKVVISKVNSFCTLAAPRTVRLDGVSNVRDIGGYYSEDGKYRMKQGIVYRGADFENITEEGINKAVNILGIKTEIDLREADPNGSSPLGASVNYVSVSAPWYTQVWDTEEKQESFLKEMRVFTDASNFPVYFHCSLGRDRTGTLAFFLEALCGVSEKDITMDYETSFFSNVGGYVDTSVIPSNYTRDGLYATFHRLRQETGINSLYEAVRACLKSKGMTDAELDAIRANLLTEVH